MSDFSASHSSFAATVDFGINNSMEPLSHPSERESHFKLESPATQDVEQLNTESTPARKLHGMTVGRVNTSLPALSHRVRTRRKYSLLLTAFFLRIVASRRTRYPIQRLPLRSR